MAIVPRIFEFFLLTISFCMGTFSLLADPKKTGEDLLKLFFTASLVSMFICFVFRYGFTYVQFKDFNLLHVEFIPMFVVMISALYMRMVQKDVRSLTHYFFYALHLIAVLYLIYFYSSHSLLNSVFLFSSAMLLGVITFAMSMGHWYLVTPKLSEKPLMILNKIMWGVLVFKVLLGFYWLKNNSGFLAEETTLGAGYLYNWVFISMRVLWGYIAIGIMSYFSYRLVKMRSIQSATGVFYAMTILVFIGELVSLYIFWSYNIFI